MEIALSGEAALGWPLQGAATEKTQPCKLSVWGKPVYQAVSASSERQALHRSRAEAEFWRALGQC